MANSAIVGILRALLTTNAAEFSKEINRASDDVRKFGRTAMTTGRQTTNLGRTLTTMFTLPLVAGAAAVAGLAIQFESSFAGVRKTVEATEAQFVELAQGFRDLSKEIPINVNELNRIGEAAGQLGIETDTILGFTEVMAKLGVTTNLSADQAATALARLANITQMPQDQFDRLGSTIVALGNSFATTEAEITDFALRIAGAGQIAGLTEAQILGIGAAMSSVGVQAEAGGTAVQKVLNAMTEAVATANEDLAVFAEVAGTSAEAFAAAYRQDAGQAFADFVQGLGRAGDDAFVILDRLGLGNERVIRAFLSLANAGDLVVDAIDTASDAWRENTALTEEAEKRFETTQAQLTLLWNRVKDLGITLGNALLPMIRATIGVFDRLLPLAEAGANAFARLPIPIQATGVALLGLVAAAGPVLFVFGQAATGAAQLAFAFTKTGFAARGLTGLMTGFTRLFPALASVARLTGTAIAAVGTGLATVTGLVGAILGPLFTLTSTWDEFFRILSAIGSILTNVVLGVLETLVGWVVDLGRWLLEVLGSSQMWQQFLGDFARGMETIAFWLELVVEGLKNWRGTADSAVGTSREIAKSLKEQADKAREAEQAVTDVDGAWKGAISAADLLALSTDELNKTFAPKVMEARARDTDRLREASMRLLEAGLKPLTAEQARWGPAAQRLRHPDQGHRRGDRGDGGPGPPVHRADRRAGAGARGARAPGERAPGPRAAGEAHLRADAAGRGPSAGGRAGRHHRGDPARDGTRRGHGSPGGPDRRGRARRPHAAAAARRHRHVPR